MPIPVTCRSCHAEFRAPDTAAGKSAKCPKCGGPIEIPSAEPPDEIVDAVEDSGPATDVIPAVPSTAETAAGDRKPCPLCGEMIMRDAVKCRYCGEVFDPLLRAQAAQKANAANPEANLTTGEWVVAILCSTIGCIMGLIWMIQGKPKGKKMVLVSFCSALVLGLLRVMAMAVMESAPHHR